MPFPTDGSHQLPIPTDELVVGEVLFPRVPRGPAVASGPSAPVRAAVRLRTLGGCLRGRTRALGTCARSPCLLALRHGGSVQGPWHLRYPPLTQSPGGRSPPCPTECPRSRRCPRRGRWRPRSPVLHRAPHVFGKVKCRKHLVHPRYISGSAWKSCSASSEILSTPL